MNQKPAGSAVIVGVGPSNGLGAALCRRFAAGGHPVYAAARNADNIQAVAAEIEAAGGTITALTCDATDEAQVRDLMDQAEAAAGGIGVAIYNAGNNVRGGPLEMTAQVFERTWRVTCLGGFLVAQAAAKCMVARGHGTILFTGATASLRARPPYLAFASGKFALKAVAEAFARDLGPQGIHVAHVVIDGGIHGDKILSQVPDLAQRLGEDGLLQVDDIAEAYWHLHGQARSAWSFELNLRPYKETF